MKRNATFLLVFDAMMIALFVVLSLFLKINIGNIKITIAAIPIIITAVYLGYPHTIAVSVVGEFLYQLLSYGVGPTTLLWMLPGVIRGIIICAFMNYFIKKNNGIKEKINYLEYFIMILISGTVVFALNTFVLFLDAKLLRYSYSFVLYETAIRFVSMIASTVVYTFTAKAVNDKLSKITLHRQI